MLLAGRDPLLKGNTRRSGNTTHRPQQVDQAGQVVRPHVEQRAAADLIVKIGVGMPRFGTMTGHKRHGSHRLPDPAIVDQLAAGLLPTAQKGIRGTTDPQPACLGGAQNLQPIIPAYSQGFLRIDVLAGLQNGETDLSVSQRHRQVDDDRHVRVCQQVSHAQPFGYAKAIGLLHCPPIIHVGNSGDFQGMKAATTFDILSKDLARADETDLHLICHEPVPHQSDNDSSRLPPPSYLSHSDPVRRSATAHR